MGFESLNEGQFFKENRVATGGRVVVWLPNDKQLPAPQLEGKNEVPSFSQEIYLIGGNYDINLWTPSSISTTAWYDASNLTTITETAGAVSQLDDLSGNGYHAVQAAGSRQPITGVRTIGGRNVLDMDGVNDYLRHTGPVVSGNPDLLIAAVVQFDTNMGASDNILFVGDAGVPGGLGAGITGGSSGYSWRFYAGFGHEAYAPTDLGTPLLLAGVRPSGGDIQSSEYWRNGTEMTATSVGNASNTPTIMDNITIGHTNNPMDGAVGELVVIQKSSANIREKVEGYLAWKWSLVSNLPVSHPYKNNPPTV